MQRISSSFTFVNKWVFPIFWFGFLGFFVFETVNDGTVNADPLFLMGPVFMAVIGFFVMRKLVWDLADSVDDFGSYLVVRRNGREARIDLKNVMNVSATTLMNPPRITLRLVVPCELGKEVSFTPQSSLIPFAKNVIAEQLIERVYHARGGNAR